MNKEREAFEKIERVKDILSEYDWFFDFHSNQYVLESHSGDIGCLQASSYLDGLWYMWQSRVPEGYVVVPVEINDEIESAMFSSVARGEMPCDIYKAMIEAGEK